MIHKIIKGSYFKGALRYVLDPNKGLLIGGTFSSHQSPFQIAQDMREVAGDRLRKPVFHAVLSLRPGESLSNDQWNEAARRYLAALGYDDAPYVLVRHTNREHDHVHIIASRVRYDGTVVSDRQDRFKGLAAVRELSREYGLSLGASSSPRSLLAAEVRALVHGAADGRPSFTTFLTRLESAGIRVTVHASPGRKRIQGLSFGLDGTTFKASQLGRELSWSGLQKLGVQFEPDKDLPLALARSPRQPRQDEGSTWTPETIRDLSRRLRTLRTETRAGGTASRDLLRHGSQAFRLSSHVAHFLEGSFHPSDAARRIVKTLAAGDHLSLALSFLGAFRSPGTAALFLLRIARRATATPTGECTADPAVLFLRQLAHAAAGDRPSFEVFGDRLAEAGVHLAPGAFALPDRVVSGRAIGLDAAQLERLGVQNARERFGEPHRPLRDGDRDRRDHGPDSSGSHDSPHPGLGPDRGPRATLDAAPDSARGARAASSGSDHGADLGRLPPAREPQTSDRPDLGHSLSARPRDEPSSHRGSHDPPAPVVPERAAPGPTPDGAPSRGTLLQPPGGPPTGALLSPSGAFVPPELALQLQALGNGGVEIRVRSLDRTVTHRILSSDVLEQMAPALSDFGRRGASLEIRSLDSRVQHLSGITAETIDLARRHGAEPAVLLQRGNGTFDVWLRHSPGSTPETLPYLQRALRAEYGQPLLGPSRHFGLVAGLDPTVRLIEATGRPYTRAQALADFFAASRRALEVQLAQRLEAVGVSSLAQYRALNPGQDADREWSRFALRQGLAPRDVALELVRSGARAQAGPRAQALYASRILAATLPAVSARDLPNRLLATASQVLGAANNVLSIARFVFHQVTRLTLGPP